jgi:hypothetical protein
MYGRTSKKTRKLCFDLSCVATTMFIALPDRQTKKPIIHPIPKCIVRFIVKMRYVIVKR